MAVDLRIPPKQACRTWLENYLLAMEKDDVLDVTRERRPPHYHVAVFPDTYEQYVVSLPTTATSGETIPSKPPSIPTHAVGLVEVRRASL